MNQTREQRRQTLQKYILSWKYIILHLIVLLYAYTIYKENILEYQVLRNEKCTKHFMVSLT